MQIRQYEVDMKNVIKVSNLPPAATEDSVHRLFSKIGAVLSVHIFATQVTERFAVISFYSSESAKLAERLNGLTLGGCPLKIEARQRFR